MRLSKRNLLITGGVILVVIGVAAVIIFSQIQALTAPTPLTISYQTTQTARPAGSSCIGGDDSPGVAKEIINLETDDIYVAGGANAMPDDVWEGYTFRLPVFKNSTRNLLFQGSCFFRSPDALADCTGDACFTIDELFDYTWLKLTTIAGQGCFPDANGCRGDVVDAGYISISTIAKCHEITYDSGETAYVLSDGMGNRYVMHATATGTPDLNPALPDGWTVEAMTLDAPLVLLPFGGGDSCYYNIVRDNLVQAYHQFEYAQASYP